MVKLASILNLWQGNVQRCLMDFGRTFDSWSKHFLISADSFSIHFSYSYSSIYEKLQQILHLCSSISKLNIWARFNVEKEYLD
jgi:hypothetical protein